jgi:hypothetical protein
MAYTDLLNETLDDLAATLATITGLRVVTNPQNINPPCVFLDAPSFTAFNFNIVKMTFMARIIGSGPGNETNLRNLLNIASQLLAKKVAVLDGRATYVTIGGQELAAYDLTINIQGQTA